MAEDKKKTAAVAGVGITAAALIGLWAAQKVRAAPKAEMTVSLDDPAMQALLGIFQSAEEIGIDVVEVIRGLGSVSNAINNLAASLGVAIPKLENPPDITAFRVLTTALDTPVQLPDRTIPYDKELVVKAMHTNTGVIFVAPSRAAVINPNSSYWLIANEAVEYEIRNADHIWISAPTFAGFGVVGDGVVCTVEQERA